MIVMIVGVVMMMMKVGRVESSFTVLVVHVENVSEQLESLIVEITDLIIIIRSEELILLLLLLLFCLLLLVVIVGKVLGEVLITPVEDGRERISVVVGVIDVIGVVVVGVVCYWERREGK